MYLIELRQQVLEAACQMVSDRIAHNAQGNISALDRSSGHIAITPSAVPYARMTSEDIAVIDLSGAVIAGKWKPTSEVALHLHCYRTRLDIGAVVHSHAPYASVFAITHEPVPCVLTEAATCLAGPVPVAPYGRPGTMELARITVETLADGAAVILAQHGLLTVGTNLEQAYAATLAAETSARLVVLARAMGSQIHTLDQQECSELRQIYRTGYQAQPVHFDET